MAHFARTIFPCAVACALGFPSLPAQDVGPPGCAAGREAADPRADLRLVETRANEFVRGRQHEASLAADRAGRLLVVWSSRRQERGDSGVYGRLLDPLGRPLTPEVHLNTAAPGDQLEPSAAFAPDGSAWVAWRSAGPRARGGGIYLRRFAVEPQGEDGAVAFAPSSAELRVSGDTGDATDPAVAVDAEGRLLVAWSLQDGARHAVVGRFFAADGRPLGEEFVFGTGSGADALPAVAAAGERGFVAVWGRFDLRGGPAGIFGRLLAPGAGPGPEFRVDDGGAATVEPSVDADAAGGFVVAWMASVEAGDWFPMARRFAAGGRPLGPSWSLPASADGPCQGASAAVARDGRFLVAWCETGAKRAHAPGRRPMTEGRVMAQVFDAAGEPAGDPFRVHADDAGPHRLEVSGSARRAVWAARGQLAFAWHGRSGDEQEEAVASVWAPAPLQVPEPAQARASAAAGDGAAEEAPPERDLDWVDESDIPGPPPPPGPDFGFDAFTATGWIPPDPDLGVGLNHIVAVVNVDMRFFDKLGNRLYSTALEPFFGTSGFVFDPTALWDPHSGRYVICTAEQAPNGDDYVDIAVSDDGDPMGTWYKYRFNLASFCDFVDFPNLGIGRDAIFVAEDCFSGGGNNLLIFDKTPILNGQPASYRRINLSGGPISTGAAKNYDTTPEAQYFLSSFARGSPYLRLYGLKNPLTNPQVVYFDLNVGTFTQPPDAQQKGTTATLDTIDVRVKNAVVRNGHLWCSHNVNGGDGAAKVRWYEIDLQGWPFSGFNPTLVQSGKVDPGSNIDTWFGDVHVDAQGNMAVAYSRSSPNEYPSIERTYRLASDPPGTVRSGVTLQSSPQPSYDGRWGDYSGMEEDPAEPGTFWSHNEYTTASWRTWAAHFDVAPQLTLVQTQLFRGQPATFMASNANPGETVLFGYSLAGQGSGPCYPQLGGLCLDILAPVTRMGSAVADATGTANLFVTVPSNAPVGTQVWSQAVVRRGPGGVDSVKSNVTTEVVQ